MRIIKGSSKVSKLIKCPILTLGNFDGVHKGHQKIIKEVVSTARRNNGTPVLYTFTPHPVKLLSPDLKPLLIQTIEQKAAALADFGIELLIIEPFTKALSKLSAKEFFEKIVVKRIGAKGIVVGYDFTFGQHRSGTTNELEHLCKNSGIEFSVVEPLFLKETLISSTHIRHFIEEGEIEAANKMLGREFSITGKIVKGRGVGGELGFHTANMKPENELAPPTGVFITKIMIRGKSFSSVTNIGFNPTFGGNKFCVETHILDFRKRLIGERIELFFYKKIRREMTFESPKKLREQIKKDVEAARRFHAKGI